MKNLVLILAFLALFSCNNDDDVIECALFDPIIQTFYVELIDNQGNNLFENGTFNSDDVVVSINGFDLSGVIFNDVPGIENIIVLSLFGQAGDSTYEIQLSDTITDTLVLNLVEDGETVCNFTPLRVNAAIYNDVTQTIEDFDDVFTGELIIRVVR